MKSWIWQQIQVALPEDWEMLRYSRNRAAGSCLFADRYQYRLELSWRRVPAPPDFPRMMNDYIERLHEEDTGGRMALELAAQPGGWQGVEGRGEVAAHSRYGTYLPAESLLVEVVFFWPEACETAVLRAILESVGIAPPTAAGRLRWQAVGLQFVVEPELELETCDIQPAAVTMAFGIPEKDRLNRRFQRLGMVDRWLQTGVDEWLLRNLPRGMRIEEHTQRRQHDHSISRVRGRRRRRAIGIMKGRWLAVDAAAWRCPRDGRLYCSTLEEPLRDRPDGSHADRQLACCSAWEAGDG